MCLGTRSFDPATVVPPGGRGDVVRVSSTNSNALGKQVREERGGTVRVGTYVEAVRALGG